MTPSCYDRERLAIRYEILDPLAVHLDMDGAGEFRSGFGLLIEPVTQIEGRISEGPSCSTKRTPSDSNESLIAII